MEIKKITKTDGKRMFVELSKNMIEPKSGLPPLKKGGKVMVLPQREFTEKYLDKMLGKQISYFFLMKWKEGFYSYGETKGILVENKKEFWPEYDPTDDHKEEIEEYMKKEGIDFENTKGYAIMKYEPGFKKPKPIAQISALTLSEFYDVQFSEPRRIKKKYYSICSNQKCKLKIYHSFKYCPNCGRKNKNYHKDTKSD
jgi:NADH pyrophosphatase NudC (nudix superfamily)